MSDSSCPDSRIERARRHPRSASASLLPQIYHEGLAKSSTFESASPSSLPWNKQWKRAIDEETLSIYQAIDDDVTVNRPLQHDGRTAVSSADNADHASSDAQGYSLIFGHAADDAEITDEPSCQVDYLSHRWCEEDVLCSWKYIMSTGEGFPERSRLENASWRTWAKLKYDLQPVSPERLNWLKDYDVTWLYGPFSQAQNCARYTSKPASRLLENKSLVAGVKRKSNLREKGIRETVLQRSISTHSLEKQAAAAADAEWKHGNGLSHRPCGGTAVICSTSNSFSAIDLSDLASSAFRIGVQPTREDPRHVRFDNTVEQCIAVNWRIDSGERTEGLQPWHAACYSSSSSEDEIPLMEFKALPIRRRSRASRLGNGAYYEPKSIVRLPSTTLPYWAEALKVSWTDFAQSPWQPDEPLRSTTPGPTVESTSDYSNAA